MSTLLWGVLLGMIIAAVLKIPISNKHTNFENTSFWVYCLLGVIVKILGDEPKIEEED